MDHFYFLYSVFETLNTYTVTSMFVDRVQKRHFYLFVTNLIPKNISGNLLVVYFSLSMLFLPFFGIITWKSINHNYDVAVYNVNPPNTPYFFVYNWSKCILYLWYVPLEFKTSILRFFLLRTV